MRVTSILVVLALVLSACSDHPAIQAHDYGKAFALGPLEQPELRIWAQDFESGLVTGYVVRPGLIAVYSDYPGEPGPREVRTTSADELLSLIPQLRRVRVERCQLVMDGDGVVVEGEDSDGRFAFAAENHSFCEGYNLHILDRVLSRAQTVTGPDYGEETF